MTFGQRLAARIFLPFIAIGIASHDWLTLAWCLVIAGWVYVCWVSEDAVEVEIETTDEEGET